MKGATCCKSLRIYAAELWLQVSRFAVLLLETFVVYGTLFFRITDVTSFFRSSREDACGRASVDLLRGDPFSVHHVVPSHERGWRSRNGSAWALDTIPITDKTQADVLKVPE